MSFLRRRINPLTDEGTFLCLLLAGLGFSDKLIREKTGLSTGQISLRTRRYGLQRKHYRNGESLISKRVLSSSRAFVSGKLRRQCRELERKK